MLILLQVYGDNAMRKNSSLQVGETFFWGKRKCMKCRRIATKLHG